MLPPSCLPPARPLPTVPTGAAGGPQVDAGDDHVELVAKDMTLSIYVNNDKDQPVDAKGFKATGLFVVGGKAQRIELKHESENSSPVRPLSGFP